MAGEDSNVVQLPQVLADLAPAEVRALRELFALFKAGQEGNLASWLGQPGKMEALKRFLQPAGSSPDEALLCVCPHCDGVFELPSNTHVVAG